MGNLKKMHFSEFLDNISSGSDLLYMTTQNLGLDEEDRPELMAPPVTQLVDDFPYRPSILKVWFFFLFVCISEFFSEI